MRWLGGERLLRRAAGRRAHRRARRRPGVLAAAPGRAAPGQPARPVRRGGDRLLRHLRGVAAVVGARRAARCASAAPASARSRRRCRWSARSSTSFVESQLDRGHRARSQVGDASSCRASWSATSAPRCSKLDAELGAAPHRQRVLRQADPRRLHRRRRPAELGAGRAQREPQRCSFVDAHRLVALFFGAMGINEHAKVQGAHRLSAAARGAVRAGLKRRRCRPHICTPAWTHGTYHGTTILSVRRGNVGRPRRRRPGHARQHRRQGHARARCASCYHDQVLAGFAGATADAFTLFERFEAKLEKHQGHLVRAAIELTKDWRTDRVLRRLEAMLAVADQRGLADHHRQRRRARARARHRRHRLGRRLRAGRRARAAASTPSWRRRTSSSVARDRRRPVHLHQPAPHHRDAGMSDDESA